MSLVTVYFDSYFVPLWEGRSGSTATVFEEGVLCVFEEKNPHYRQLVVIFVVVHIKICQSQKQSRGGKEDTDVGKCANLCRTALKSHVNDPFLRLPPSRRRTRTKTSASVRSTTSPTCSRPASS